MNVKMSHCSFTAIALSLLTYAALTLSSFTLPLEIAVAVSVLIAGILVPVIANQFASGAANVDDESSLDGEIITLYVGNLPYRASEEDVKSYFQTHATVQSVRLMKDKRTGKRKGYGFVEVISSDVDGAIDALNDSVFQDRTLKVRHAKEKVAH